MSAIKMRGELRGAYNNRKQGQGNAKGTDVRCVQPDQLCGTIGREAGLEYLVREGAGEALDREGHILRMKEEDMLS